MTDSGPVHTDLDPGCDLACLGRSRTAAACLDRHRAVLSLLAQWQIRL